MYILGKVMYSTLAVRMCICTVFTSVLLYILGRLQQTHVAYDVDADYVLYSGH